MDILESLNIMQRVHQVVGMTQLKLERTSHVLLRSRPLEIYSVCLLIASLVALICRVFFCSEDFYETTNNSHKHNHVSMTGHTFPLISVRVTHILCIVEALSRRNEERRFFENVRDIDRIFEYSLNINVENSHFRRKTLLRAAIVFVIYMSSELFTLSTLFCVPKLHLFFLSLSYLLPFLACTIRCFQIFTAIAVIKCRLDILTSLIHRTNLRQGNSINCHWRVDETPGLSIVELAVHTNCRLDMENPQLKQLLILRDLYDRIWELTCVMNRCFGFSMLINVGHDFLSIISNCYWVFLNTNENYSESSELIPLVIIGNLPHLCNVVVLSVFCDRTEQTTINIALAIHRVKIDNSNDNHNTVIKQFSLQLLHQKIIFTAAEFFKVDSRLLYTIISAATTYLIILIQFHSIK